MDKRIVELSLLILFLILFHSMGCENFENNTIKDLENIIEKDFPDISTNSKLIPLRKLEISNYEDVIKKFETKKKRKKESFTIEKPSDINSYKTYLPIGDYFFFLLISRNSINKGEFKTIKDYILKYNNVRCQIKTKSSIGLDIEEIYKHKKEIEFQEFGYPIMYENTLIFFRNNYNIKSGLETVGSGSWYLYEKKNDKWELLLRINQWIT